MSATTILTSKPTNLAITTNPSHDLSVVEVPIPSPAPGECLIHVTATGICGSDVHFWKHGGIGSSKITCELGLGHESAGEVVGLGEGVEGWTIGKSVFFPLRSFVSLNVVRLWWRHCIHAKSLQGIIKRCSFAMRCSGTRAAVFPFILFRPRANCNPMLHNILQKRPPHVGQQRVRHS